MLFVFLQPALHIFIGKITKTISKTQQLLKKLNKKHNITRICSLLISKYHLFSILYQNTFKTTKKHFSTVHSVHFHTTFHFTSNTSFIYIPFFDRIIGLSKFRITAKNYGKPFGRFMDLLYLIQHPIQATFIK